MTALKPAPDWELVYKRNPVERIKRDRSPLGILDELPALIAAGGAGPDDRVVLLVTGDGLKTPGPVADRLQPVRIAANADALLDRLAAA